MVRLGHARSSSAKKNSLKAKFSEEGAAVNFSLERAPHSTRSAWPRFYCWTVSGYLHGASFGAVIRHFVSVWGARDPIREALLFDHFGAHMLADTLQSGLEKFDYLFFLAPNTSHISQPLDEDPFGSLKRYAITDNEQAIIKLLMTEMSARDTLLDSAHVAEQRALTPSDISRASRRCALKPLDRAALQAQVAANVGIVPDGDTTLRQEARAAVAGVLQEDEKRIVDTLRRSVSGQATVPRGVLHSSECLFAEHSAREAKKGAALVDRASRPAEVEERRLLRNAEDARRALLREHNRCRVCRETVLRGGGAWVRRVSNTFWVCPTCAKTAAAPPALAEHSQGCTVKISQSEGEDEKEEGTGSEQVYEFMLFFLKQGLHIPS